MCLHIKGTEKTAKIALVGFKVGRLVDGFFHPTHHNRYGYKKDALQRTTVEVKPDQDRDYNLEGRLRDGSKQYIDVINEGYHMNRGLIYTMLDGSPSETVQLFIIPKGATYYKGKANGLARGYAANQIVWLGSPWNPLTWLKVINWQFKDNKDVFTPIG